MSPSSNDKDKFLHTFSVDNSMQETPSSAPNILNTVFSAIGGRQPRCTFAPSFHLNAGTPLQRTTSLPSPSTPSTFSSSPSASPRGVLLEPFHFHQNPLQTLCQSVENVFAKSSVPLTSGTDIPEDHFHYDATDHLSMDPVTPINNASSHADPPPIALSSSPMESRSNLGEIHRLAAVTAAAVSQFKSPDTLEAELKAASVLTDKVSKTLDFLKSIELSPLEFFSALVDHRNSGGVFTEFQRHFFHETSKRFDQLLDVFWSNPKAKTKFSEWMLPHAVSIVTDCVYDEMEQAKPYFRMSTDEVTPEFLVTWNIRDALSPLNMARLFPTWSKIIEAATQSKNAEKNRHRSSELGCKIVTAQVLHLRSVNCCKLQSMFGLFAWAHGASRQVMEFLSHCSLSTSFTGTFNLLKSLADKGIERGRYIVAFIPHALGYDNINLSTSIFVEQTGSESSPSKVQSGTFSVIYELHGVRDRNHMLLSPILSRLHVATPFTMAELRPTAQQRSLYMHQASVSIVRTLLQYSPAFSSYEKNQSQLANIPWRPLPSNLRTKFYPLRVSTIEASVQGNLRVHDDIYITQLKRKPSEMNTYAIPLFADQLTNSRCRGCIVARAGDLMPWLKRQVFQLGMGLFHLQMNLAWCILNKHRYANGQVGEKPDYHTLTAALAQIHHGLLLDAWRVKSGKPSLAVFAQSNPAPADLLKIAREILLDCACPADVPLKESGPPGNDDNEGSIPSDLDDSDDDTVPQQTATNVPQDESDPVHQNVQCLLRDLLYFEELTQAISSGDFGRLEDILPDLAALFRGSGSNNYSTEILHLLYNLKKVWTPEFADIMRDNHIINVAGLPGHFMPMDLNIEHLIGYLKQLFAAKGIYSTWHRLGNISAAVVYLQNVKKHTATMMGNSYQKKTHTTANVETLVLRIAEKAQDLSLNKYIRQREGYQSAKHTPNLLVSGYQKFESSSLATFNKKMKDMINNVEFDAEIDEMVPVDFGALTADNDED
ncbi:hypothetical protein EV421DRAFT_1909559 [Armillaria borealis]|uniref:DUF6589 domain-containing protein n=1 Tax=Armillaria borealis TaxID=47425 RepID=A0AA39J4L8_9AGAR|nr:hypothetical protein EV421DRAFT_1909559 [Armillaria borealis]